MPDEIRLRKIASFFQEELARLVKEELKDPVFEGILISFPNVKVNRDLSLAYVDVSVYGDGATVEEVVKALSRAEPILRNEIKKVCDIRRIPLLRFRVDTTMQAAAKIDSILDMLDIPPDDPGVEK